jgi:hypothetical protein
MHPEYHDLQTPDSTMILYTVLIFLLVYLIQNQPDEFHFSRSALFYLRNNSNFSLLFRDCKLLCVCSICAACQHLLETQGEVYISIQQLCYDLLGHTCAAQR